MGEPDELFSYKEEPSEMHADFASAFQDGLTLVDRRRRTVAIRVMHPGDLVVNTGHIVACDPFGFDVAPVPYTTAVPIGKHPVLVSVVAYEGRDQRVACAMLRFTENVPMRWEMALIPGQDPNILRLGEYFGYAVEAGTGCFVDHSTVEALRTDAGVHNLGGLYSNDGSSYSAFENDAKIDGMYDYFERFNDRLLKELETTGYLWAAMTVDVESSGNIIAFSSGWGDGVYPSFFGYDAGDNLACLVTDFQLLRGATQADA